MSRAIRIAGRYIAPKRRKRNAQRMRDATPYPYRSLRLSTLYPWGPEVIEGRQGRHARQSRSGGGKREPAGLADCRGDGACARHSRHRPAAPADDAFPAACRLLFLARIAGLARLAPRPSPPRRSDPRMAGTRRDLAQGEDAGGRRQCWRRSQRPPPLARRPASC